MEQSPPFPTRALERLEPEVERRLGWATAVAAESGAKLWWVGGGVRDLLLGRRVVDLDLVVERGAEELARRLASRFSAGLVSHPRFLSATVELPDGALVDVATARRESYATPGALPTVEPASIVDDLARRDFSVNAIAVRLLPLPRVAVDPQGGARDLEQRRLRILHPRSFVDDPTRLVRGVRFEIRLGMTMDAPTESAARAAVAEGLLAAISPERLRAELERTLESWETLVAVVVRLEELGVLAALTGGDSRDVGRLGAAVAAARAALDAPEPHRAARRDRLTFLWLALGLSALERERLASRLGLAGRDAAQLVDGPARIAALAGELAAAEEAPPHRIAERLAAMSAEEVALAAAAPGAAERISRTEEARRGAALAIDGDDLIAAGVPPGPALGRALRRTREARLDGRLRREDELAYALREAGSEAP